MRTLEEVVDEFVKKKFANGDVGKYEVLEEMASVGLLNSQLEVWVWTNDPGQIPHFHIWDKATQGKKFHSCVKLESPEYFIHGDKMDKLNSKMRKQLSEFMNAIDEDSGNTNWWATIYAWNKNNSSRKVPMDMPMPDYGLLPAP